MVVADITTTIFAETIRVVDVIPVTILRSHVDAVVTVLF